jgi:hypothetical protein
VQTKNRQQMLVLVAIVAVALFAGDKLLVSPLTNAWGARSKRIADLRRQVTDGTQLLRRQESIRSRWQQIQRSTLPNNTSAAEQQLHQAIDAWGQESRVNIAATTPQWKRDADDYMTYQCRVEASGTLATLSRFLYDIEKDPMALKLDSVEIGAHDKEGQQLSLAVQINGLVLTPQTQ